MKTTPFTLTTRDGMLLPGQAWLPAKPRAFITIVHGLGEHSGRYKRFAETATARGFGVISCDLRSHGRSPGERTYVDHFSEFLLDVDALMGQARQLAGPLPIVLMGHSMGGTIAMRWIAERQPSSSVVTGLVLSSAALKIGPDVPKPLQLLAPIVSLLAPHARLSGIDPKSISRDPAEVKAFKTDPLVCLLKIPARTGAEILSAIAANRAAAGVMTQPLYIFHGGRDTLTDPNGSRDMHQAWGGSDKTLRIWTDSVHETLNDLDRVAVARELLDWVEAKVTTKAAIKPARAKKAEPASISKKAAPAEEIKLPPVKRPAVKKSVLKAKNGAAGEGVMNVDTAVSVALEAGAEQASN